MPELTYLLAAWQVFRDRIHQRARGRGEHGMTTLEWAVLAAGVVVAAAGLIAVINLVVNRKKSEITGTP